MQTDKITDKIVDWLKEYATNANVKGYVVGVSGGVDSAVVSTLCAMTGLKTLLIEMPIRQNQDEVNRAWEHMEYLKKCFMNVEAISVNLINVSPALGFTGCPLQSGLGNKKLCTIGFAALNICQ